MVGFALETGDALAKGRAKLERKDLDLIVVNDALEPGAGFEKDTNRVALLGRDGIAADPAAAIQARGGGGDPGRGGAEPWPMNGATVPGAADRSSAGPEVMLSGAEAGPGGVGRSEPTAVDRRRRLSTPLRAAASPAPSAGRRLPPAASRAGRRARLRSRVPASPSTSPEPTSSATTCITLETLEQVAERIRTTHCCGLCPNRTNAVPGEGNPEAQPGAGRRRTGRDRGRDRAGPSSVRPGTLLNGILEAIEVPRDSVYITNIVKCRPPQNRKPLPDEIAACIPYLHRQLELIRPKVILALGGTAGEAMLGVRKSLGELRGKVHTYNGIPLVVTYHPAALLRNPNWKKPTWDDVRIARQLLDR